jgi:peptidoglycan/LPS O-acetylase OafA/YrhL
MPHPLLRVVAGFALGAAIFAWGPLAVDRRRSSLAIGWFGLAALAALVVGAGRVENGSLRSIAALLLAGAVVIGLASGTGPVVRVLGSRPLEYGGRVSYGIYMIHGIVLMVFGALLAVLVTRIPQSVVLHWPLVVRLGVLLVPLAVVLALGLLLYRAVERPAQQAIAGWALRR